MITALIVVGRLCIGGAERVCRNIGYYADPEQFQIDYLVFGESIGDYEAELEEKGCRIWHMPLPSAGYFGFYRRIKKLISERRYDVVHSHTMFNSGMVLRAAKRCGVPVRIAHSHSIRGENVRTPIQNAYEKTMRRWILRYATHYVGCGQAAGEWLFGRRAFRDKGIVLLNGIETERFRYDPTKRAQIRRQNHWEDCFVIGHAGHMAPVKNQIFLIKLMPEILKRRPNARLVLLGDGDDRPMLEQAVRTLGLDTVVFMPGNVPNVNEYLSAMDVFAFPSLHEGMPLAILEVQANGLPCVISDRVPKDVFQTVLLSPLPLEDSESQWADALLSAERSNPEQYSIMLHNTGANVRWMLEKLYQIYQGQSM